MSIIISSLSGFGTRNGPGGGSESDILQESFPINGTTWTGSTEFGSGSFNVEGHSAKAVVTAGGANGANQQFSSRTDGWVEFDMMVDGLVGWGAGENTTGSGLTLFGDPPGHRCNFGYGNDGGTMKWMFHPQEDGGGADIFTTEIPFVEGTWIHVVMEWSAGTGADGIARCWINGILPSGFELTTQNSDTLAFDTFTAGQSNANGSFEATTWVRNIKIGSSGSAPF